MRAAPSPRAARAREDLADVRRPRDERETQATPVSSRSSALCKRVLGRNGIRGSGETAAILYSMGEQYAKSALGRNPMRTLLLSTLKPLFVVRVQPWRLALARAHRDARASSAPHFAARVPLRAIPALPSARSDPPTRGFPALARHVLRRRVRRAPAQPQGRPPRAALREQERDRLLQRGGAHERRVCVSIPRSARSAIAPRPRTNRASRDAPAPRHARRQTLIDLIDWDGSRRTSAVSDPAADPASFPPRPSPPVFSHRLPRELLVLPRPHGPPPRPDDDRDGEEVLHQRRRGPAHALLGQRLGRLGAPS